MPERKIDGDQLRQDNFCASFIVPAGCSSDVLFTILLKFERLPQMRVDQFSTLLGTITCFNMVISEKN